MPIDVAKLKICSKCGEAKPATAEYFARYRANQSALRPQCKVCRNDYQRRKRSENPEPSRVANRLYHATQREKVRARKQRNYRANPEPQREYSRRFRADHPEYGRVWHINNPEKTRAKVSRRRARKNHLEATLTATEYKSILEHYGNACAYCGRSNCKLEQDHIAPVVQGGGYTKENIVPACRSCNRKKHARTPEQAGMKLRIIKKES